MNILSRSRTEQKAYDIASPNDLTASRRNRWNGCWLLLVVGVVTALLCAPLIRSVYWLGDEGVLLHGATQILRGNRLYVDFFEFLPPGGFMITAAWLDMVGTSMLSVRALAILSIVGIACFTFLACWQVSTHATSSVFVAVGWVVMSQGFWTQINHHWFTTLFSMAAASAAIASVQHPQRWMRWPLVAGAAAGVASMVTPTRGALAMLAAATAFVDFRRYRAELIAYIFGCALVPTCLFAYVIWHGDLLAAFEDIILFPATRYTAANVTSFGRGASYQNLPLKYLFPLAALLALLTCTLNWRTCLRDRLFHLTAAFGLAGFIGCFPRPDIAHIGFAAPLVCPLVSYCVSQITQPWLPKFRYAAAVVLIGLSIPSVRSFSLASRNALIGETVGTPRGNVNFPDGENGARELVARIAATPSEDAYFFYPYMPMLPFLTARQHVSKYDILMPGYTLPSQYQEACISAVRHASWLVIDRNWTDPNFLKIIFPGMQDAPPPEKMRFEEALAKGFEFVAREGSFEMHRRTKAIDESVCRGIAE